MKKLLLGYALGFASFYVIGLYNEPIIKFMEKVSAKMELKRDILIHDNPNLRS